MAIKSYTNQKNAKAKPARPRILNLIAPVALPNNISDKVQEQIFEVLKITPFKALSIPVCAYAKDVRDPGYERKDGKTFRDDKPIYIGYVRKYDAKTNTFTVSVMERFVRFVESFINPAIEVAYAETFYGEFKNINRFNLIALGPNNYSSKDDKEAEKAVEDTADEDRYPKAKANSVPVYSDKSLGDIEPQNAEAEELLEIDDSVGEEDSTEVVKESNESTEEDEPETTTVIAQSMEAKEEEALYEETRYIEPPEKKDSFQVTIGDVVNPQ